MGKNQRPLIKKCVDAIECSADAIEVWGDGSPTREFLYVEDAAEGIVLAAEGYNDSLPVNLGSGDERSIKNLVETIARRTGFEGKIVWDITKPNGQPRRSWTQTGERAFSFRAKTDLESGLACTVAWYREQTAAPAQSQKGAL